MKRILATTAIMALTALPLHAEGDAARMSAPEISVGNDALSAETLIGKRLYIEGASDGAGFSLADLTDAPDSWTDVGEVGDVIVGKNGEVRSVIADIGGFLGVGEREVALSLDNLHFAADRDDQGDYFVLYRGERELLEDKSAFDRGETGDDAWLLSVGEEQARNDRMNADNGAESTAMADPGDPARPGDMLAPAERAALTAGDLEGQPVEDSSGERIGEISDLVLTEDGTIDKAIVDIGGFLGIGEKPVALPFSEIEIARTDGDAIRLSTGHSASELEQMTRWEG
ncbi:PRC-barrel domain-containing protein [Rhodovulum marinum]|uniref:PRC-barrel domain protein n=1 Tax=Rhodovulum marinum TaxID=320662 RepID=A0A4R2Q310_9RHOB|nr:PRC-barrel domain-containing protein [Rhodovulum marinum]TCP43072.1 PRC-barrel domain protein [Rhodovulum marinum]